MDRRSSEDLGVARSGSEVFLVSSGAAAGRGHFLFNATILNKFFFLALYQSLNHREILMDESKSYIGYCFVAAVSLLAAGGWSSYSVVAVAGGSDDKQLSFAQHFACLGRIESYLFHTIFHRRLFFASTCTIDLQLP